VSVVVLDASVAVKWFLPASGEPLRNEALGLMRRYANGEIRFVVPDLFRAETANILWKAVRQRRITIKEAESS
jgi:predicted nucleic acid-binding protein